MKNLGKNFYDKLFGLYSKKTPGAGRGGGSGGEYGGVPGGLTLVCKRKSPGGLWLSPLGHVLAPLIRSNCTVPPGFSCFTCFITRFKRTEFSIYFGRQVIHRSKRTNRTACGPSCLLSVMFQKRGRAGFELYPSRWSYPYPSFARVTVFPSFNHYPLVVISSSWLSVPQ